MNTCANCSSPAVFSYRMSASQTLLFCVPHVPKSPMVRAGLVNIASQEEIVRKVAEVANSAKKSKTATVINSVSDEEVVDSNSNENEPTEEEVNSESEPGND